VPSVGLPSLVDGRPDRRTRVTDHRRYGSPMNSGMRALASLCIGFLAFQLFGTGPDQLARGVICALAAGAATWALTSGRQASE
jgi:hypothetical protein